jgi:hypothetical protein
MLSLPIKLSSRWDNLSAFCMGFVIPLSCSILYGYFNLKERRKRGKERSSRARADRVRLLVTKIEAVCGLQESLRNAADSVSSEGRAMNGLVILSALYGKVHDRRVIRGIEDVRFTAASVPSLLSSDEISDIPQCLDVTLAIQALATPFELTLPHRSKEQLPGFVNPSLEGRALPQLNIKYVWRSNVYEITISDDDPLTLPSAHASLLGRADTVVLNL